MKVVRSRLGITWCLLVCATVVSSLLVSGSASGSTPTLARYPYLSDLTSTSVVVTWSTSSADTSNGVLTYGPAGGSCTGSTAVGGTPTTYTAFGETAKYYQHSVTLQGLSPSTSYCYLTYSGNGAPGAPLLGSPPQFPTTFRTTPAPGSAGSFSFDVLGDWGETNTSSTAGTYNPYQDALSTQIAKSATDPTNPALFALSTGDIAYNNGSQTNYGDLNHPADGAGGSSEVSDVFDARYWAKTGSSLPLYSVTGNHGRNATFFSVWPSAANVSSSNGTYTGSYAYPSVDGYPAGNYPSAWYAFTVGTARFYVLDADWTDLSQSGYPNLGTACTNGTCPTYQLERDEHWQQTSAEYKWLTNDLAQDQTNRGPDALRLVFFHYPLRVDQNNYTTQSDVYLQNSAANPTGATTSLEALLAGAHVNMIWNGHAHMYERNVAPLGGVPNYVTGGGGGVLTNVITSSKCSPYDAYARGWTPSSATGSSCGMPMPSDGAAAQPTSAAQVYHFLKVTVNGSDVSVRPTDSTGAVFDPVTYHFAADAQPPTTPGAPSAVLSGTTRNVKITLGAAATDNVGVVAYDVYRDGNYVATLRAGATAWTENSVPGGTHVWTISARDQRGNASQQSPPSAPVTLADVSAPSAPGQPVATTSAGQPGRVSLSWAAASDDVGVTSYTLYRNGVVLAAAITGTSTVDSGVSDVATYTYTVTASDAAGNTSPQSASTTITTPDWTPPTAPTVTATAGPPGEIDLSWSAATDNVGVSGYDVYRDGGSSPVATGLTGNGYADTGLGPGSTHSYMVVARDAAGNSSPPSAAVSATVVSTVVPVGPPTALTATQQSTPGQVLIGWSAPTQGSPTGYAVSRNGQLLEAAATATSFTDTNAPDGTPVSYTVTASDAAGNQASASTSLIPDWSPPTSPGPVTVTATAATTATISWQAATDTVAVTGYTVTRSDGIATRTVATVAAPGPTTFSDSGLNPGTRYTYTVTASDAAGNQTAATGTVTQPLLVETFEAGTFTDTNAWTTPTPGLALQQASVHNGSWAAEEISTGSPTWSSAQLPSAVTLVRASAWVYVKSRSTSAGFFKLRTSTGAYIAYLYVNSTGNLAVRNDAGNVTHVSTTTVPLNQWLKVELYLNTNPGGPITIIAALDGHNVTFTTPVSATETLGTTPPGQIVLGDTVSGRTYDIAIDDLIVDTAPLA